MKSTSNQIGAMMLTDELIKRLREMAVRPDRFTMTERERDLNAAAELLSASKPSATQSFEAWAQSEGLTESLALMIARRAWIAASPQAKEDTPAKLARDAVRMLEGYAESYESMAKMDSPSGDGTVQCRSVARDIRANMAGWFGAHLTEQATATQPAQTARALTELSDEWIEMYAQRHIAPGAAKFRATFGLDVPYQKTEQFKRMKAYTQDVIRALLTAAHPETGEGHD